MDFLIILELKKQVGIPTGDVVASLVKLVKSIRSVRSRQDKMGKDRTEQLVLSQAWLDFARVESKKVFMTE